MDILKLFDEYKRQLVDIESQVSRTETSLRELLDTRLQIIGGLKTLKIIQNGKDQDTATSATIDSVRSAEQ